MLRPLSTSYVLLSGFLFSFIFLSSCGNEKEELINNPEKTSLQQNANNSFYRHFADATKLEADWKKENTLYIHSIGEPNGYHPTNDNSANRTEVFMLTQVFLLSYDYENQKLFPYLAKTLPEISANEKELGFELRDFMKWDNGEPITAEDVAFTIMVNKCPLVNNPQYKPVYDQISRIETNPAEKFKLKIVMKEKYILNLWLWFGVPILQKSYYDPANVLGKFSFEQFDDPSFNASNYPALKAWAANFNDPKYANDPAFVSGGGPYKLVNWDNGQSVTFVKKPNHWSKDRNEPLFAANPDKIIYRTNKDANSAKLDFKNQLYDATTFIDPVILDELLTDSNFNRNYNADLVPTNNYSYAAFNMKPDGIKHKKLFTDKKVRRAIAHLIPVDDINLILSKGRNKRMITCLSPFSPSFNKDLQPIPYDLEKAKSMLAEAGWKDTDGDQILDKVIDGEKVKFEFEMIYMNSTKSWETMAALSSESLLKAGIKANLRPIDFSVLKDYAGAHNFDMLFSGWSADSGPQDFSQLWHTSSWSSQGNNYTGFGNAESDALIKQINETVNDSLRLPLEKKFQQLVYEEQPYIFLFSSTRKVILHKRFGNRKIYFDTPGVLFNTLKLLSAGN